MDMVVYLTYLLSNIQNKTAFNNIFPPSAKGINGTVGYEKKPVDKDNILSINNLERSII